MEPALIFTIAVVIPIVSMVGFVMVIAWRYEVKERPFWKAYLARRNNV